MKSKSGLNQDYFSVNFLLSELNFYLPFSVSFPFFPLLSSSLVVSWFLLVLSSSFCRSFYRSSCSLRFSGAPVSRGAAVSASAQARCPSPGRVRLVAGLSGAVVVVDRAVKTSRAVWVLDSRAEGA